MSCEIYWTEEMSYAPPGNDDLLRVNDGIFHNCDCYFGKRILDIVLLFFTKNGQSLILRYSQQWYFSKVKIFIVSFGNTKSVQLVQSQKQKKQRSIFLKEEYFGYVRTYIYF